MIIPLFLALSLTYSPVSKTLPADLPEPAVIHEVCPLPPGWLGYEATVEEYRPWADAWVVRFSTGSALLVNEIEGPNIAPGDPVIVMVTPEGEFFKAFLNASRPVEVK